MHCRKAAIAGRQSKPLRPALETAPRLCSSGDVIFLVLAILYDLTTLAICGYAFASGGSPERIGAAINLAGSLATIVAIAVSAKLGRQWSHPEIAVSIIDMMVLAAFFELMRRSDRFWPIWAFAFAVSDVFVHLARPLLPETGRFAYATSSTVWAYLALAALLCGTIAAARERRGERAARGAADPSGATPRS